MKQFWNGIFFVGTLWVIQFLFLMSFLNTLFIFREGKGRKKKHQCVVASCIPHTGDLAHNPGMCPRLGIELAALWFAGLHSIRWAILARAVFNFFKRFFMSSSIHFCKFWLPRNLSILSNLLNLLAKGCLNFALLSFKNYIQFVITPSHWFLMVLICVFLSHVKDLSIFTFFSFHSLCF